MCNEVQETRRLNKDTWWSISPHRVVVLSFVCMTVEVLLRGERCIRMCI